MLGDKAATLSPDLCRRPSGRFHVTHLGPAERDGDPEIKQTDVNFSAHTLKLEEDILYYWYCFCLNDSISKQCFSERKTQLKRKSLCYFNFPSGPDVTNSQVRLHSQWRFFYNSVL